MFSIEQRERVHERLVEMAREDARVIAGAVVGSQANGPGDRWSDVDLTFGLAPGASIPAVLADWTRSLAGEFGAVKLFDQPYLSSVYRVFLFPGSLQVDVSFTPGAEFGAIGPGFRLLFGDAVERPTMSPPSAEHQMGLAVHHAVRARICIERGRVWQAEHWISGARDLALALACMRHGLEPAYARGADRLPPDVLAAFDGALVRSLDPAELTRALTAAIETLRREARSMDGGRPAIESVLAELIGDLESAGNGGAAVR